MKFYQSPFHVSRGFVPYLADDDVMSFAVEIGNQWRKRDTDIATRLRIPFPRVWVEVQGEHTTILTFCEIRNETDLDDLELSDPQHLFREVWKERLSDDDRMYVASMGRFHGVGQVSVFIMHPHEPAERGMSIGHLYPREAVRASQFEMTELETKTAWSQFAMFVAFVALLNSPKVCEQRRTKPSRLRTARPSTAPAFTRLSLTAGPRRYIRAKTGKTTDGKAILVGGHWRGTWHKRTGDWALEIQWIESYVKGDPTKGVKDPRYKL